MEKSPSHGNISFKGYDRQVVQFLFCRAFFGLKQIYGRQISSSWYSVVDCNSLGSLFCVSLIFLWKMITIIVGNISKVSTHLAKGQSWNKYDVFAFSWYDYSILITYCNFNTDFLSVSSMLRRKYIVSRYVRVVVLLIIQLSKFAFNNLSRCTSSEQVLLSHNLNITQHRSLTEMLDNFDITMHKFCT